MIGRLTQRKQKTHEQSSQPKGFDDYELRLGDMMRGERATMGKSLLDVQRELRIKASYIAAIENADPTVFDTDNDGMLTLDEIREGFRAYMSD